jgi:protein-tyrosine phosphatase
VIDLHSHVLPGLDDGAPDLAASLEIVRAAAADGIEALAATPHVRDDYPTTPGQMEAALGDVRAAADGLGVELLPGGELALDAAQRLDDGALRRFGLGGNPAYLLVETPYFGWRMDLPQILFGLRTRGFTPVLAHPERNGDVQADPETLASVVAGGTLVQLTAASVDGRLGRRPRDAARALLDRGYAHMIASDAHAPTVRAIGMAAAREALADAALARWLTEDVPRAVVAGTPLPERPARSGRRRKRFGLF